MFWSHSAKKKTRTDDLTHGFLTQASLSKHLDRQPYPWFSYMSQTEQMKNKYLAMYLSLNFFLDAA